MATASTVSVRKVTKEERTIIVSALDMLIKSQERAARAATGEAVRAAYVLECGRTQSVLAAFTTGELEL